ncbi:Bug family tripartite tricarboxylate transporter substrate binding protein [Rhodoplanes sp. Z2-YC6860]|uniref:Bug family tripartite tricarboxylate transporter substrate binding protein n=1 Tax=Rhodoplanes sp. Z2-YC6860 TaxID=674703 RepID=UPI00078C1D2F|nr:tripartite tricarboxylate transporter substrate binding protein [Rhodoplanes sp. Z2-YC6860]AMN44649.1 extra-cytoplasmic solute receptor protein [Rhodoplanes sp. Z2-YC6860]
MAMGRMFWKQSLALIARRGTACLLFMLCALTAFGETARAEDPFPSHQITLIAPFAAGGSADIVSRILAEGLGTRLGQTVIVDNKPGGNSVIGIREAIKSKPDGYTILLGSLGANVTPALMQKDYPFDPLRDYMPIATVAEWSALFVVNKKVPVSNLKEFIAYAKERPGKINFGATGYGGLAHMVSEVFMQQTGISMQHVQYKAGSQATTDLLSGAIDAHMMSSPVAAGQIESTQLKFLAVASKHRLGVAPNVPTMAEEGYPGIDQTNWQAIFAPPGLPQPIRDRLAQEILAVASDPATQAKMKLGGFEPLPLDGPATERMYRDEIVRWTAIIKERGLGDRYR